jgi:phospholipid transport system substrate-binding protein
MKPGLATAVVVSLGIAGGAAPALAGAPTDQLKGATDRVLQILQDTELKKPDKTDVRRKQIRDVANQIFDWQETGKRALARGAQACSPQQRQEFSPLFAELIERSYVSKLELYSGERIVYAGEAAEGDQATVRTKLVTKSGTEVPIEYRMQKDGERWRVYDVTIEGVSLVGNYRSQFNRIIQQSNCDELMKKLKTKQDELVFDETERGKKKP